MNQEEKEERRMTKADMIRPDTWGCTPLHIAAKNGDLNMLEILLNADIDINVLDNFGNSPLMTAIDCFQQRSAVILLAFGANVNESNGLKETPLHLAVKNCQYRLVKILLLLGADSSVVDRSNRTPMYYAMRITNGQNIISLLSKSPPQSRITQIKAHLQTIKTRIKNKKKKRTFRSWD